MTRLSSKSISNDNISNHIRSYITGFILSVVITVISYIYANQKTISAFALVIIVVAFAIAQLLVQLVFFLHLDRGSKPHWNFLVFSFMLMVVIIIVFGSLWIMYNLNYGHAHIHTLSPQQITKDEGLPQ